MDFFETALLKTREFAADDSLLWWISLPKGWEAIKFALGAAHAWPFAYSWSTLLPIILVCVAVLVTVVSSWPQKYDLDKVPGPWKRGLPFLGNVLDLIKPNHHRVLLKWADEYGGIYRMRVLWKDILVVTDPREVGKIVGRGSGSLDKAASLYMPINEMVTRNAHPNLLTAVSDDKWKVIRKAVAVSFSHGNIKKKFPMVLSKVNELAERLRALGPEESVDVDQAALRVTLDVIGLTAFGHDFEAVKHDRPAYNHLLRVLPRCFTEVELRMANPFRSHLPGFLFNRGRKGRGSFKQFQGEMEDLLKKLVAQGAPAEDDYSIAAQLFRIRGKEGLCDQRLLSEIGILFVEGFETTGHTVSWALFAIATNPRCQDRVAAELDKHGLLAKPGCSPREMEYDDLRHLTYLNCCIKEAMRMYPVVSVGHGRTTAGASKIGPYMVPPKTLVTTPLYPLQNSKHNWDRPMEFKPERWASIPTETFVYNSRAKKHRGEKGITFMPFSDGPRNCVGQSLAKMEVMALLVKLIGNFRFKLDPMMGGTAGITKRESTHLTLQTKGTKGIRMHLLPRAP